MEILKRDDFYAQGRRICLLETEAENDVIGAKFYKNIRQCPYRKAKTIGFTEKYFAGSEFAECTHPEKSETLSNFCPPLIERIKEEPC